MRNTPLLLERKHQEEIKGFALDLSVSKKEDPKPDSNPLPLVVRHITINKIAHNTTVLYM